MGQRRKLLGTALACLAATTVLLSGPAAGAASSSAALKTAREGVLVTGDFPTGWSGTRPESTSDSQVIKAAKKIPSCSDYVKLRTTTAKLPEARSLDFSDGLGTSASNVVNVFSSTAKAKSAMKLWSSSKMPACLEKFTQQAVGTEATVTIDNADVASLGAGAVGYTAEITDATGVTVEVLLSIAVPVGSYVSVFTIDVQSETAALDAVETAVNSALTRLEDAVKS